VRVVWTETALRGVWRAYDYLMDFNSRAGAHLAESLLAAGDGLANFPHRGRPVRGTSLRELVTVSPYIIRYRVAGDTALTMRYGVSRGYGRLASFRHHERYRGRRSGR